MMIKEHMLSIEAIPTSIAIYKATGNGDFIFVDFNKRAETTEKITKESLLGRKVTEVFPGIKSMGLLDVFQRVSKTGEEETLEINFYEDERMSGWRKNRVIRIDDDLVMALYEDVSAENGHIKEFEQRLDKKTKELERQERAFERLFDKSSDGVLIIEDGKFVQCNEKIVEVLKYDSKEELLHVHPSKLSPEYQPDGRHSFEKANEMMSIAFEKGGHSFEWKHTRADGEDFWAEVVLTPISLADREIIHVVWRDISKRKEMETRLQEYTSELELRFDELAKSTQALKRQEMFLERSQEIAHIGVWEYDMTEDTLYWSNEIYKIFGLSKEEFEPTYASFLGCVHEEDRDALDEEFAASIETKREYFMAHRIIRPDGSLRYVEERGEHSYSADGDLLKSIGVALDITGRKELEIMLLALNRDLDVRVKEEVVKNQEKEQQLFAQSRLAQMGEMISMIAHQWRQPLGAISTTAVNLKLKLELEAFELETPQSRKACSDYFMQRLSNIEGFVQNLTMTIDDFRNFYRPNKKADLVLLEEPLSKAVGIIQASFESDGIEIIETLDSRQKVKLYVNEMMQVILNILKNAQDNFREKAIKYPKVFISCEDIDNSVVVKICDNGGGIPKDIMGKVFDPYFSTKDEKNGTGLGLYMSKTIIEEHHNGTLSVDDHNDSEGETVGACFKTTLQVDLRGGSC